MTQEPIRTLIVEDDPDQAALITRLIQKLVVESEVEPDGARVLDHAREYRPDIILLDYNLPGKSGLEILEALRTGLDFDTMIIVQSAEHKDVIVQGCLEHGAYDYVRKPYSLDEFSLKMNNYVQVVRQKKELREINDRVERERDILKKFFPRDFTENLLSGKISNEVGGSLQNISTLICDLRGSTRLAEDVDPVVFARFLSDFFADVADLIFGTGGSINNFRGDGFLATFGVPNTTGEDAQNAVRAAVRIRSHLETVNMFPPDFLGEPIRMGIGISTGRVFVGNIGSVHRLDYTVLGDAVNLAARLESLTKKAGADILVDGPTRDILGADAVVKKVKLQYVRGKKQEVRIYSLVDYRL